MPKPIIKYEHEFLHIKKEGLTEDDFKSLIGLNSLHGDRYFSVAPNGIRFKQYVGVIQLNNRIIEIHPKADRSRDSGKWQNVLTDMLKACGRIKIHTSAEANLSRSKLNLLELYFDQYLSEVESLVRNGLIKQYRKEASNVKALKGKLDFAQNLRRNLVHKERFFTVHQVYNLNHRIHQVLAQAIDVIGHFSTSMWINDKCRRVQLAFPEVKKIQATKTFLDSIQLNRKTSPYERALELARLIILNYSPDISQGNDKMISILFDMNQLWEEYVFAMLKKYTSKNDEYKAWSVVAHDHLSFWNSNALKPDIVLTNGLSNNEKKTFIIDTKWKTLEGSPSNHDLRQMYAYAHFWKSQKVMLLYPGDTSSISGRFKDENSIECFKNFVSVLNQDNYNKLNESIGEEILKYFLD